MPANVAVLFDLDDTLVDHTGAAHAAVTAWVAEIAPHCQTGPELTETWLSIESEHYDVFVRGDCSFAEQRRRRLRAFLPLLGLPVDESTLDEQFAGYVRHYEASWRIHPDVIDALVALRGRQAGIGVLTNGDDARQRAKLARVGLGGAFDMVATSAGLGRGKPHPAAFTTACALLGRRSADVWYVGDNLAIDCLAAEAAGLRGVWLNRRRTPCPPSVRQVDRLTRVPGLLPPRPVASGGTAAAGVAAGAGWAGQLHRFADALPDGTWMVTGSAALVLYGVAVQPDDIDIVTDGTGLDLIRLQFPDSMLDEPFHRADVRAAARLRLPPRPTPFEILVDVRSRRPDGSWSPAVAVDDRVPVHWSGRVIPVAPLSKLYRIACERGQLEHVKAIQALLERYGFDDPYSALLPSL